MTHDKVRQDFEAWCTHQVDEVPYDWAAAQWGIQYGRAAERAEIREKLESEGVVEQAAEAIYTRRLAPHTGQMEWKRVLIAFPETAKIYREDAKAAITKILEVI